MPTRKETDVQIAARVSPELHRAMRILLARQCSDFTKWVNRAMQEYVDKAQAQDQGKGQG